METVEQLSNGLSSVINNGKSLRRTLQRSDGAQ